MKLSDVSDALDLLIDAMAEAIPPGHYPLVLPYPKTGIVVFLIPYSALRRGSN